MKINCNFGKKKTTTKNKTLTDIRRRTALTAVHRSFLRSMIKLNPRSASCSLHFRFEEKKKTKI